MLTSVRKHTRGVILALAITFVGFAALGAVLEFGQSNRQPFDSGIRTIPGPDFTTYAIEPSTLVLFIDAGPGDHIRCGSGPDAVEVVVPPGSGAVTRGGLKVEWDDGSLAITCNPM